jgi:mevalonate kinase
LSGAGGGGMKITLRRSDEPALAGEHDGP